MLELSAEDYSSQIFLFLICELSGTFEIGTGGFLTVIDLDKEQGNW